MPSSLLPRKLLNVKVLKGLAFGVAVNTWACNPAVAQAEQFPAPADPKRQQVLLRELGLCLLHRRPGVSAWLLVLS